MFKVVEIHQKHISKLHWKIAPENCPIFGPKLSVITPSSTGQWSTGNRAPNIENPQEDRASFESRGFRILLGPTGSLVPPEDRPPIGSSPGFTLSSSLSLSHDQRFFFSLSLCLSPLLSQKRRKERRKEGRSWGEERGTKSISLFSSLISRFHIWLSLSSLFLWSPLLLYDRLFIRDSDG